MSFLPIYIYFIALSFFVSLSVFFTTEKTPVYLKLFPPFLLATLVIESIASYLSSMKVNNLAFYNFFTVFEFCFYLWVINLIIRNTLIKKVIKFTILIYCTVSIVNIIYIQHLKNFHTVTYALGCLLIVAACVYYFFELFRQPTSVNLNSNPAFWICSGLLFFYCCGFPLFGMFNILSNISRLIIRNFYNIIIILNIFLYTLFTIAFLCRVKIRKYT